MSDLWIRVIAAGFAVAGFMYGHKKGYSLAVKFFLAFLAVVLSAVVGGILLALILPDALP